MGLFSSSTRTKNTSQGSQTGMFDTNTTTTAPEWLTNTTQQLLGQNFGLGARDPQSYVAGSNQFLDQAGQGATNLDPFKSNWNDAAGMIKGAGQAGANTYAPTTGQATNATAASLLDNLPAYMSPYTNNVVDTTLAGYDRNSDRTRSQQALGEARSGAFGGSGAALTRSMTEGELALGRASTEAGLRDQAFNTGASLSNLDAGRRQETSQFNANAANQFGFKNMDAINGAGQFNAGQQETALNRQMAGGQALGQFNTNYDANQRANIATQQTQGGIQREIDQQKAQAPLDLMGWQMENLPPWLQQYFGQSTSGTSSGTTDSTSTGKTTSTPSFMQTAGQAAQIAAMFSDARLKTDIETVGYDEQGRRWVEYNYIWDAETRHRGVLAQEVAETDPHAVIEGPNGFLMVDYGAL